MYRGILFDFDGTLARTMDAHFLAWQKACADFGISLSANELFPLEGMKIFEIAEIQLKKSGLDVSRREELGKSKESYYIEEVTTDRIEFYPGVFDLVDELHKKEIPIGIVTASFGDRLKNTVPEEFLIKFNALVTGDLGGLGKPFPDPYLRGARLLGLEQQHCIAVENAPLGIESAKAAGMYCVGIASTVSSEKLLSADIVVADFRELSSVPVIKKLVARDHRGLLPNTLS